MKQSSRLARLKRQVNYTSSTDTLDFGEVLLKFLRESNLTPIESLVFRAYYIDNVNVVEFLNEKKDFISLTEFDFYHVLNRTKLAFKGWVKNGCKI